ncbi:MAG TPA: PKD domain-containing protein [Actinophytocola sp.]|uniref:PKD domain-containing protein n=1 Tax=Actinophytocola sp. TaxID=1872138 RepID=UPI002DF98135|nr:PKD domain-containing protein [Actinophytocola sp.]
MKSTFGRGVGRGSLAAVFAAAVVLFASLPSQAATDERDQYQTLTFNQQKLVPRFAQTFTAGKTGQLDRVTLGSTATSSTIITVSLQTVDASGLPSGTTLGTPVNATGPWTCCAAFKEIALTPIAIETGRQYAIVVEPLGGTFAWKNADSIDAYAGGHAFLGNPWLRGSTLRSEDFAFETWVITATAPPPNAAPSISADTAAVVVNEGTRPTNSGAFSDPDGDTVTLTASQGTVTKTGTGRWAWTRPESDEGPAETVTITADDGHGHPAAATFTVRVDAVAPVAQIITDPPLIPEGSPEKFTGGATLAYAGDAADIAYTWTVTKGGATFATGSGTAFTLTPDDDGAFVVTFKATDTESTLSDTDSVTVYGQNVAPTARITGVSAPSPLVAQEAVTFTGSFTDPGVVDTHTVTWTFGDGTSSKKDYGPGGSATFSVSHIYTDAKTYTVRLQVVDDDNGADTATTTVTVQTTQQALKTLAGSVSKLSGLTAGQKSSLIAKLDAAAAAAARGDNRACNNQLNAFLNELTTYVKTGQISEADAAPLRTTVTAIKASLGTFNRFLEWLTLVF